MLFTLQPGSKSTRARDGAETHEAGKTDRFGFIFWTYYFTKLNVLEFFVPGESR